jgi:outer membrane murein-binding lipoprotein Lpp
MRSPSIPEPWPDWLPDLVADLGGRDAVARLLRVTPRQVDAWVRVPERAPRAVLLALLYESPAGRAALFTDHANEVATLRQLIDALEREVDRLRQLAAAVQDGAANAPVFDPRRVTPDRPSSTASARAAAPRRRWVRRPARLGPLRAAGR